MSIDLDHAAGTSVASPPSRHRPPVVIGSVVATIAVVAAVVIAVATSTQVSVSASNRSGLRNHGADRPVAGSPAAKTQAPATTKAPVTTQPPLATTSIAAVDQPPAATNTWYPGHIIDSGRDEPDPFLAVVHGRYYLFTSEGSLYDNMNVPVVSGTQFGNWGPIVDAMPSLPAWAAPDFTWAPDLHRFGSTYVLYFTALVTGSNPAMECIGAATGLHPSGPFVPLDKPFICQVSQGGSIDPRVFTAGNGASWMIWKSDQNIGGSPTPTKIWSAPLSADGLAFVANPTLIMQPDQTWQGTIVEAPDMVEVGGKYWLFYSGNWFNSPSYAIGAASCAGPQGPCADTSSQPLLGTNLQGTGPGEASVFRGPTGDWMLYSPWRSMSPQLTIPPRPVAMTRIGFGANGPYLATWQAPPSSPLSPGPSASSPVSPSAPTVVPPTN